MERVFSQSHAVLLAGGEREKVDQITGDVRRPCIVGWKPVADDFAAGIADRLRRREVNTIDTVIIVCADVSHKFDYETELLVVMGKRARNVSEADALGHVAGYAIGHDFSARDLQLEMGGQWMVSKTLDDFAPIGPFTQRPVPARRRRKRRGVLGIVQMQEVDLRNAENLQALPLTGSYAQRVQDVVYLAWSCCFWSPLTPAPDLRRHWEC